LVVVDFDKDRFAILEQHSQALFWVESEELKMAVKTD
jgi:hypothetical protein